MRQARQAGSDQPHGHASDPGRIRAKHHQTRSGTEQEGGDSRMKESLIRTGGSKPGAMAAGTEDRLQPQQRQTTRGPTLGDPETT